MENQTISLKTQMKKRKESWVKIKKI